MEKDIDKIYRRRFEGAKMPPPEDSWENILSQLPPKKAKRRLVPIWVQLGGVAAAVALLLTLYSKSSFFTEEEKSVQVVFESGKFNFEPEDASVTFQEVMKESQILLQALILQHELQDKQKNIAEINSEVKAEIKKEASGKNAIPGPQLRKMEKAEIVERTGSEESSDDNISEEISGSGTSEELASALALAQKEEPAAPPKSEDFQQKFKLSTRIAPVYFNNFGNGNVVNKGFSEKEASGEVTFSYGVSVAYAVTKNINLRGGINKVNLEYNTRQVSFNEVAGISSYGMKMMNATTLASPSDGTLQQKMGFLEVPLELEYLLVDKDFSLGIIGGGSVLFLEENDLSLALPGEEADLGGANRMNKLSYTTNIGLGLGYNLSKQLQLSVEPVVKFQMNTFKDSGGQKPYFLGLYAGFSYRF
ncbi:outer membrane beta-barrel protein [Salinimicrobium sp. WS361]|uniref:outer membrane beta-barrel protein n=1 Tax=Salinimicrobium sp. WS361 TaxID=3425123 RepID=UPI003D7014E2